MVLTAQGTPFIHSGQEYGRTKQFRDPAYKTPVAEDKVPNKSHLLRDKDGNPFDYPYFIHDSYDSSDAINKFDWTKATDRKAYPENVKSRDYMKGLIALRQSTDAFRLKSPPRYQRPCPPHHCSRPKWCGKRGRGNWLPNPLLQTVISTQSLSMRMKSSRI